jgi:hypothetical protein
LFAAPPRDRNAAPLYLDALFEFEAGMAVCFPEGPERDRRLRAADDRSERYMELHRVLEKDPKAVPPEAIDAVITLYETGFRMLAEAQRRDPCVFEVGLGDDAPLPHLQSARQVARVASLRVRRAVEQGDFDAAIRAVEEVLRLARDLRPRGSIITQMVAGTIIERDVCDDMVKAVLAGRDLRVEHCDRLLKGFLSHEASSSDGYAEGLRVEYLTARVSLRDLARKQAQVVGQASPAESSRQVRDLTDYYRALLSLDGLPYAARIEKIATLKIWEPGVEALSKAMGRASASLRATECLIVMRRWQLTHRGLPRALLVAAREAGLKAVPADPFDGKPMRVAVLEGQAAVYSVGKDGRDDGGQKDSRFDSQPGDLIYPRPPTARRPESAPAREDSDKADDPSPER